MNDEENENKSKKDDNINYKYHKPIGKSKHIFKVLYNKLSKAATLIKEIGASEVIKITTPDQIVKPRDYDNRSFPAKIMDHINKNSKTQYFTNHFITCTKKFIGI